MVESVKWVDEVLTGRKNLDVLPQPPPVLLLFLHSKSRLLSPLRHGATWRHLEIYTAGQHLGGPSLWERWLDVGLSQWVVMRQAGTV